MINVRISKRKHYKNDAPPLHKITAVELVLNKIKFYKSIKREPRYCIMSEKSFQRANMEFIKGMLPTDPLVERFKKYRRIHGLEVVIIPNTEDEIIELGF